MAGQPKISVVVAVYNPGPNIDGLLSSLDRQSLSQDELEVVFVDDGSTDGTYERLLEVEDNRPNVRVATIPNSGWPGRPRNVGTDLARGEYVFFADHDDEFFPQALERMYAMASANGSDIVYGKIVRVGLPTPYWPLARHSYPKVDVTFALNSLTVHKLFRREFLREHQIRFPEGKVRLEDHNFMAQALPRAEIISVLADYPCYRWIQRADGSNSSSAKVDQRVYWEYYAGVLRTLQESAGPGPLLDAARVTRMLGALFRFPAKSYLRWNPADRADRFEALHTLVLEQFPSRLDDDLPVLKRLRVQAARAGELSRFDQLQESRTHISFAFQDVQVSWDADRLSVAVDSSMVSAEGLPLEMDRVGDDVAIPVELGAPTGTGAAPCVLSAAERGTGEITIRHRVSGVEWPVDCIAKPTTGGDGKATLGVHIDGTVDPTTGAFGSELETGIWDVQTRVQFLGEHQLRRIPITEGAATDGPQSIGGRKVIAYRTRSGTLALKILAPDQQPPVGVLTADWESEHLVVTLDLPGSDSDTGDTGGTGGTGGTLVVRQRGRAGEQLVPVLDRRARIVLGSSARGDIFDFWLRASGYQDAGRDQRVTFGAAEVSQRLPYRIYATVSGFFSAKNVEPPPPAPHPLAHRARRWISRRSWPSGRGGSS